VLGKRTGEGRSLLQTVLERRLSLGGPGCLPTCRFLAAGPLRLPEQKRGPSAHDKLG